MSEPDEILEQAGLAELHRMANPSVRARLGLRNEPIGDGLVSVAGGVPDSGVVANRTIGLGLQQPADRDMVARVAALYRAAGVARYFVHVHPAARPAALRQWLSDAGLEQARGWMKFVRGRAAPPEARSSLQVRPAGAEDAADFGRIAATAFDLGEAAGDWLACMVEADGWHPYLSFDGDTPAGTGAMFVRDGLALLDWGATDPAFRKRGSQSALLRRRILDALDLGCTEIYTETGEEVAGDPQHSYNNILRMGFKEAYVRENYAPPRA